jgi:hypothetical protein
MYFGFCISLISCFHPEHDVFTMGLLFCSPVTNLRDKLVVAVCNVDDEAVTQIDIEIPSIVERGYRDEFMDFNGGGRIHLILSFALTDEERRKIQIMVCQLFRCVACCLLS